MTKIKFGTDGWRAIIAKDFTVDNVARVAKATADFVKTQSDQPSVCIGNDCRFAGKLLVDTCTSVFLNEGVKVYYASNQFVSTPMVSLATLEKKATVGVVMTASHNPPDYQGYKLKGAFGGPMLPDNIAIVESLIPDQFDVPEVDFEKAEQDGLLVKVDLETMYYEEVMKSFDINLIKNSGLRIAFDAMYGAGQAILPRILPEAILLHCDYNPSFKGTAPEPIHKNLTEFSDMLSVTGFIDLGLAVDGDADRIGLYNSKGEFIDSHRILLLLIHYLKQYKNETGKVVTAFSASERIAKLCKAYDLEHIVTKIGFKYIAGYMKDDDVMVGGEESGGIAIKGFIPERDGIWMGLTVLEFMAKTGKSIDELLDEVYEITGSFAYDRNDLRLPEEKKWEIIEKCKVGEFKSFEDLPIKNVTTVDGYKFELPNDTFVLIRPSGTEPLLRVYCEAPSMEDVVTTLKKVGNSILD